MKGKTQAQAPRGRRPGRDLASASSDRTVKKHRVAATMKVKVAAT